MSDVRSPAGARPRRVVRALALLAALALLGLAGPIVRADDAGPGEWAHDRAYKALGVHPDVAGAWGYARETLEEAGTLTEGAWLWVLRTEGTPEAAYRVDAEVGEGGSAFLTLSILEATDAEPVRVGGAEVDTGADREAAARGLVKAAAAAALDWASAVSVDAPTAADPLDAERRLWRARARALEAAAEKHPAHWGILRDLVVCYARLLPLVAETPAASTLAVLLPRRLEDWETAWEGHETPADARVARRCRTTLYLQMGPHALASAAAAQDAEDPELAAAMQVLNSLGYESMEPLEEVEAASALLPCTITGWKAAGEPKVPGTYFDRYTFVVGPKGEAHSFDTYYLVSGRLLAEGGAVRWGLYGLAGGTRKLLRLYGTTEPEAAVVKDQVKALVEGALAVAAPAGTPK